MWGCWGRWGGWGRPPALGRGQNERGSRSRPFGGGVSQWCLGPRGSLGSSAIGCASEQKRAAHRPLPKKALALATRGRWQPFLAAAGAFSSAQAAGWRPPVPLVPSGGWRSGRGATVARRLVAPALM